MNITYDSSRDLRRTRLVLLCTLFFVGLTGCSIVLIWLIRYARWHSRSARICSLILNLIIADVSVYIFATGIQIYWEFQTNRQWPFNDLLCRVAKFFQSFSILSSSYIVVAMAIDRCVAIVTPLKMQKIRILHLCGSAWTLAGLLSIPNIFIFHLHVNDTLRFCTAIFSHQSSPTGRRIYLTFISFVVYFIPFLVLVFCYTLIFIKLLFREHGQRNSSINYTSSSSFSIFYCCSKLLNCRESTRPKQSSINANRDSPPNNFPLQRKMVSTYAKARSKTFRMIIVLVLFMILFGAPYYFLELYIAYTGRKPSDAILALAGGAAVAPSSIDPWIFLLFWVNWNEQTDDNNRRKIITLNLQQQNCIQSRRYYQFNQSNAASVSDQNQQRVVLSKLHRQLSSKTHSL